MISDQFDRTAKITPKRRAQQIICDHIASRLEFLGEDDCFDGMTASEQKTVTAHVYKQVQRIRTLFNLEADTLGWLVDTPEEFCSDVPINGCGIS